MKLVRAGVQLAIMRAVLECVGCARADVYPITGPTSTDGGGDAGSHGDGQGGSANAGSAGSGGSAVSGGNAGNAGNAASSGNGGGAGSAGSPSCPTPSLAPGDSSRTVTVGGTTRRYLLHVPPAYDGRTSSALVVDFHGMGESGTSERMSSPYPAVLDPEGVIMAFPDGLDGPAGAAWNVGPCCVANVDDVAFTRALVEQVRGLACIDSARIYAVGVLTGGGMAHYLGCHAADLFAAVAPAAFDLLEENADDCTPARPISVIAFRGTADARVPYAGGPSSLVPGMPLTFLGAQGSFEKWGEINHCVGPASPPDADGCSGYSGCDGGAEVILCTKQGGREKPGDPSIAWPVLARHRR